MFSGIIETTTTILATVDRAGVLECKLARPAEFTDVGLGDSIAVDGVCLTVEHFDAREMTFALGPETLRVTGWTDARLKNARVNVERSLKLGDRIHGHLVTGHVDAVGEIAATERVGESFRLTVAIPRELRPYIWSKGSVAINGVSLTVNECADGRFGVGLIPETLKRTNLGELRAGAKVNLEIDNMARGLVHAVNTMKEQV